MTKLIQNALEMNSRANRLIERKFFTQWVDQYFEWKEKLKHVGLWMAVSDRVVVRRYFSAWILSNMEYKHRVSALAVIAERKYLRETACAFYAMANKTDPWQKAGINIGLTDFAGTGGGGTSDFIASLVQRHDRALSKVAKRYQLE